MILRGRFRDLSQPDNAVFVGGEFQEVEIDEDERGLSIGSKQLAANERMRKRFFFRSQESLGRGLRLREQRLGQPEQVHRWNRVHPSHPADVRNGLQLADHMPQGLDALGGKEVRRLDDQYCVAPRSLTGDPTRGASSLFAIGRSAVAGGIRLAGVTLRQPHKQLGIEVANESGRADDQNQQHGETWTPGNPDSAAGEEAGHRVSSRGQRWVG